MGKYADLGRLLELSYVPCSLSCSEVTLVKIVRKYIFPNILPFFLTMGNNSPVLRKNGKISGKMSHIMIFPSAVITLKGRVQA